MLRVKPTSKAGAVISVDDPNSDIDAERRNVLTPVVIDRR
jgi:hypothetical protein